MSNQTTYDLLTKINNQLNILGVVSSPWAATLDNSPIQIGVLNCINGGITSTGNYQDCDNCTQQYNYSGSASVLSIVSSSVQDGITGTGIRTILVNGVDSSFNSLQESISLTGNTPKLSTNQFLHVNSVTMLSCGSVGSAVGTIIATTTSNQMFMYVPGHNNPYISRVCVPNGYTYLFDSFHFSAQADAYTQIVVKVPDLPLQTTQLHAVPKGQMFNSSGTVLGAVSAQTCAGVRALAVSGTASVSASVVYYIIPNIFIDRLNNNLIL